MRRPASGGIALSFPVNTHSRVQWKGDRLMKKHSIGSKNSKGEKKQPAKRRQDKPTGLTIGMDLGDKTSRCCAIDRDGEVLFERSVPTTTKGMAQLFGALGRCRIALEVGTHSRWVSRQLSGLGHEVIVANARQVKLISQSTRKDDKLDARTLARLARIDPELLRPIRHRSERAQIDLMQIRVRAALVEARTGLVNTARGLAKAIGERLPKCDADYLDVERMGWLPVPVQEAERFQKSRDVGCYVGLRPKRNESGERQPQLGISKEGDLYLRKMLVQ